MHYIYAGFKRVLMNDIWEKQFININIYVDFVPFIIRSILMFMYCWFSPFGLGFMTIYVKR